MTMTVKELKDLLEKYENDAVVELTAYGYTDSAYGCDVVSAELSVGLDTLLEYER